MARATRIGIALWVLAAAALAVSLLAPEDEPEGWFSYVPLSSEDEFRPSNGSGHPALDPTLWLGIAIGLAVAGAVVLAFSRRRGSGA
jgi:heme/copper-type cytochrome/quinol oxidase subunit 1